MIAEPTTMLREATAPPAARVVVDCVELMQQLQHERRHATPEEQALLARWMGWGPVAPAFEENPTGQWKEIGAQLRLLLGPEGAKQASRAVITSYFTDGYMADAIWTLARRLGFTGGNVLEPGCGSGQIISAAPPDMKITFTGIEKEPFSAAVARERFPEARIMNAPLEEVILKENGMDLVVGNVPFGNIPITDKETKYRLAIHNYFIYRAMRALRPGGLAILITSRYTLDARDDLERSFLAEHGSLVGVIRLPAGAHKAARTQVVTDILILRKADMHKKREKDPETGKTIPHPGPAWKLAMRGIIGEETEINQYFVTHMHHVCGEVTIGHGMYRNNELIVKPPEDIPARLAGIITSIVEEARHEELCYIPRFDPTIIDESLVRLRQDGLREGSYHLIDGKLIQIVNGEQVEVKGKKTVDELIALVGLRDITQSLLEMERDHRIPDAELAPIRAELNRRYDAYVAAYGAIHRGTIIKKERKKKKSKPEHEQLPEGMEGQEEDEDEEDDETEELISKRRPPIMNQWRKDPDCTIVLALEQYDDATQVGEKADIFFKRVNVPPVEKTHADSPIEALGICLDRYGAMRFDEIARLLSVPESQVPALLGDLIYEDPETWEWVLANEYLAGNVRRKLERARAVAEMYPDRYQRNVDALLQIQPEDLVPEEIKAMLGAPWIPPEDIAHFCWDTFKLRTSITFEPVTNSWTVKIPYGADMQPLCISEWGTERKNAFKLLEHGLNKEIPEVWDQIDKDTRRKNVDESLAAQGKLQQIQNRFSEWIWEDDERATRLAFVYNRLYNSIVQRSYDGSHLSFPGMHEFWQEHLYEWQRSIVWRCATSKAALCGHPVGAGKTTSEVATAMTLRKMGLTQKAAIVVPNHLLEQITAEAQRLYPSARILMVSREDLKKERRALFAARVATGDYDFVVITHSGLGALAVHPETELDYLEERLTMYREVLCELNPKEPSDKRPIKRLEAIMERMYQRQKDLLSRPHDGGVTWEQLGITYLIVDESHLYKNLGLPTNVDGLKVKPSKRAMDLEMKIRWLERHNEGKPYAAFFTATPISNSMVEAYVIAWFLDQDLLRAWNILTVDAFASMFIEFQTRVEVSANGATFKLHTRPARFVNMPEFAALFNTFSDIRSPEILAAKRPEKREYTVAIDPTDEITEFVDTLVQRTEALQAGRPEIIEGKDDNMLWVTSHGRMAALDLSLVHVEQEYSPKLNAVAEKMAEIYHRWQKEAFYLPGEFKSLQIGFCDLGTPNEEKGDQVYGKLKMLLIRRGIPERGIRFVHEARKSDKAKALLFQQCRAGQVAILLGSTAMLGTGTNIQTRGAALHHIDAPWRPDEVEQRDGRVQRPGNLFSVVEIFRYVIRRTFDAFSWQTLMNKAIFFDQFRSGKMQREMDALGDSALSYGQVKAAATGDVLVLEQAELATAINNLQRIKNAHTRSLQRNMGELTRYKIEAKQHRKEAEQCRSVIATAEAAEVHGFSTRGDTFLEEDAKIGEYIAERTMSLINRDGGYEDIGHYDDNPIRLCVQHLKEKYVVKFQVGNVYRDEYIELVCDQSWIGKGQSWRFAKALSRIVTYATDSIERLEALAQEKDHLIAEHEAHLGEPFDREDELVTMKQRKAALDAYTALVADSKGASSEVRAKIETIRLDLLKDAPENLLADGPSNETVYTTKTPPPKNPSGEEIPVYQEMAPGESESEEDEGEKAEEILVSSVQVVASRSKAIAAKQIDWDAMLAKAQQAVSAQQGSSKTRKSRKKKQAQSGPMLFSFGDGEESTEVLQTSLF